MKPSERIREIFNIKAKKDDRDFQFMYESNVEKAIIAYLDELHEQQKPKKMYQCKNIVHLTVPCEDCKVI